jgi:hypothetical protein
MIAPPESLISLLKPWSDFYDHSKLAKTIVVSLHVGGLLLGGGLAVAADRATVRSMRATPEGRSLSLRELGTTHRWVLTGLTLVILSGFAMLASDLENYWGSWLYWTKMVLFVVLLWNGWGMTRAEASLRVDAGADSSAWARLHRAAVVSMSLWFAITVLGVAVVNFS